MSGDRPLLERAAQGGLCASCRLAKLIQSSKGSVFVMCTHPELPKYPRVPVLRCRGYVATERVPEA